MMFDLCVFIVQYYQDFACCAAVPGNGTNKEYALHLLKIAKGDIKVNTHKQSNKLFSVIFYKYHKIMFTVS